MNFTNLVEIRDDLRKNHLSVYSTGKPKEWYVRLLGVDNSHGTSVSDIHQSEAEAGLIADAIADRLAPLIIDYITIAKNET